MRVAGMIRALVSGALLGAVLGVVARLLMRLVALVTDTDTEFTWEGSLTIVGLFVVAAAGTRAASRGVRPRWAAAMVAVVISAPLVLLGTIFGVGEVVVSGDDGVSGATALVVYAAAALILVMAWATPVVAWRRQSSRSLASRVA